MNKNIKKTVIFNAKFLGRDLTGVDRFALETLYALDKLMDEQDEAVSKYSFSLAVPSNGEKTSPFKNIPIQYSGKTKGLIWEQFELPLVTFGKTLINLCNVAPMFKRKQLVVIHDAAPAKVPESYSVSFRLWYRLLMPVLGRWSKQVFTVSGFSKKEISNAYGISPDKIIVLPESGEHILRFESDNAILDRHHILNKPYVLAVSSMAPHKNFKLLFEAVSLIGNPQFDVVIAGGTNPQVFAKAGEALPEFVKHVGYVTDGELKALMSHATCFVFPSIYEGFGLPVAEAMALGCPVLSSNAASLPEVCENAALYFEPNSIDKLSSLICEVMQNDKLRISLKEKGLERSKQLTWRNTALGLFATQQF